MKNEQITILFSESGSNQSRTDQAYNRKFVETVEENLNNVLRTRGHVLLNDVYDQLGMQRTGKGCTNGWINLKHEDPMKIEFTLFESRENSSILILTGPCTRIAHLIDSPDDDDYSPRRYHDYGRYQRD